MDKLGYPVKCSVKFKNSGSVQPIEHELTCRIWIILKNNHIVLNILKIVLFL